MSYIPLPCLSDRDALRHLINFFIKKSNGTELADNIRCLKKVTRVCTKTIDNIEKEENLDKTSQNSGNNIESGQQNPDNTSQKSEIDRAPTTYSQFDIFAKSSLIITDTLLQVLNYALNDESNDGFKTLFDTNIKNSIDPILFINIYSVWQVPTEFCNNHIVNIIAKNDVDFILILKITFLSDAQKTFEKIQVKKTHILYVNKKDASNYKIYKIINNNKHNGFDQVEIKKIGNANNKWWLLDALDPKYQNSQFVELKYKLLDIDGTKFTNTQHNSNYFIPITTYKLYIDLISSNGLKKLEQGNLEQGNYNDKLSKILEPITGSFILKIQFRLKGVNSTHNHGGGYESYRDIILYFEEATDKHFYIIDIKNIKEGDYRLDNSSKYQYLEDKLLKIVIAEVVNIYDINEILEVKYQIIQVNKENAQGGGKYSVKTQFKEVLGKKMRIYKIANSRKEHVKYKGDIIRLSEYRKLMEKKSNSKKVLKSKKAVAANKK
jgi:hypothetical protein